MIKLRPYQLEAIETIRDTFTREFRQYIEMPTGSGKTITFLSYANTHHKSILVIVPSKELLKQVYQAALLFYSKDEISRKGAKYDEEISRIHICIIHSIRGDYLRKLAKFSHDLIIIDEAHHIQAESYKRFIKNKSLLFHEKDMKILGVTATPDRLDGKFIHEILYHQSYKISLENLIENKYLADIEGYVVRSKIDISDVDDHNSDFSLSQLYQKLHVEERDNLILALCKEDMAARKTLVFCINIAHSKAINRLLNSHGLSSAHIDGTMNDAQRFSILSSFRNGEFSYLCNCQILTEGFDEPSIDGIILARPTKSRALFNQMIGRGLRIFPGKTNCKIIDIVDSHRNLAGFVNSIMGQEGLPEIEKFGSLRDIQQHYQNEILNLTEFRLEKVNFFNLPFLKNEATTGMIDSLEKNNVYFQHPLSFDEACFLIWYNKLYKDFYNGEHSNS